MTTRTIVTVEIHFDDGAVRAAEVTMTMDDGYTGPGSATIRTSVSGDDRAVPDADVRRAVTAAVDSQLDGAVPASDLDASIDAALAAAFGRGVTDTQRAHFERFLASDRREDALRSLGLFLATAGSSLDRESLGTTWGVTVGTGGVGSLTVNVGRAAVFWVDDRNCEHFFVQGDPPNPRPDFVDAIGKGLKTLPPNYSAEIEPGRVGDAMADVPFRSAVEARIDLLWPTYLQPNWHNPLTETLEAVPAAGRPRGEGS